MQRRLYVPAFSSSALGPSGHPYGDGLRLNRQEQTLPVKYVLSVTL